MHIVIIFKFYYPGQILLCLSNSLSDIGDKGLVVGIGSFMSPGIGAGNWVGVLSIVVLGKFVSELKLSPIGGSIGWFWGVNKPFKPKSFSGEGAKALTVEVFDPPLLFKLGESDHTFEPEALSILGRGVLSSLRIKSVKLVC